MEAMRESFKTMMSPFMRELDQRIRNQGTVEEILKNDGFLRELNAYENNPQSLGISSRDELKPGRSNPDANNDYKDLKKELLEEPAKAIAKNAEVFRRKFEMQKQEIVDEVEKVVIRESDRIIQSVMAGPHEKILDRVSCPRVHISVY